jgi:hypothetical protein
MRFANGARCSAACGEQKKGLRFRSPRLIEGLRPFTDALGYFFFFAAAFFFGAAFLVAFFIELILRIEICDSEKIAV